MDRMTRLRQAQAYLDREMARRLDELRPDRYTVETWVEDEHGNLIEEEREHPDMKWMNPVMEWACQWMDENLSHTDVIAIRILDMLDEGVAREDVEARLHDEYGAWMLEKGAG